MQSTRKDSFVLLNKLFNMERVSSMLWRLERAIQFTSLLDDTQNHGLFSELLSVLPWLNVTDNCVLSHNTGWDHHRGTQGFPPEAARRTEENVIKRHEKRCTAARWNLPLGVGGGVCCPFLASESRAHDAVLELNPQNAKCSGEQMEFVWFCQI